MITLEKDFKNNIITINNQPVYPQYICDKCYFDDELKEFVFENLVIIKTAQQVYDDQQNAVIVIEPSNQDTLNAQLLKDNASMKVEINNQKTLNSQLLLEIAKLKGGTANV